MLSADEEPIPISFAWEQQQPVGRGPPRPCASAICRCGSAHVTAPPPSATNGEQPNRRNAEDAGDAEARCRQVQSDSPVGLLGNSNGLSGTSLRAPAPLRFAVAVLRTSRLHRRVRRTANSLIAETQETQRRAVGR